MPKQDMDSRLEGLPAFPASLQVSRLTSKHFMLTCPSSLSSPSKYKRQNIDSIQFASDRARCAHEGLKFNWLPICGKNYFGDNV